MASKKAADATKVIVRYEEYAPAWWEAALMAIGTLTVIAAVIGFIVIPFAYMVHEFYWPPPPITSFHYSVFVHEDGESGDITAAGTGSVGK